MGGPWEDYAAPADGPWLDYASKQESKPWEDFAEPQKEESNLDYATGIAQSAAGGATMNFADEAAATMGSLFGLGPKLLGTKSHDEILADVRKQHEDFAGKHPYVSGAAELAGATVIPAGLTKAALIKGAPTLANAVKAGVLAGAGSGMLAGFGAGEGGAQDRFEKAAKTGAVGAAAGALGPVVGTAARQTANATAPYAQAAIEQAVRHKFMGQNVLDALLAKYTGGLSLFVTGPKRVWDVAKRGNQIRQTSGPAIGNQLGLGALAPGFSVAGSDVFSVDLP